MSTVNSPFPSVEQYLILTLSSSTEKFSTLPVIFVGQRFRKCQQYALTFVLCIPQVHPINKFYFVSGLLVMKYQEGEADFIFKPTKLANSEGLFYEVLNYLCVLVLMNDQNLSSCAFLYALSR